MRRISLLAIAVFLILVMAGAALAEGATETPVYTINVINTLNGSRAVLTSSHEEKPTQLNSCWYVEETPGHKCAFIYVSWDEEGYVLDPSVFFIGVGIGPTYVVAEEADDWGWRVTDDNDGFEKIDRHVFELLTVDQLRYQYRGSAWGTRFPLGINICLTLQVAPFYNCFYQEDPNWELREGIWGVDLDPKTYFVGSGGLPTRYLSNPEFSRFGGWNLAPEDDGFKWSPYTVYIPVTGW